MTNEADTIDAAEPSDSPLSLSELCALASQQLDLEGQIAVKKAELAELEKQWRALAQGTLPAAMIAAGATSFSTNNAKVELADDLKLSLTGGAAKGRAVAWLREIGEHGLIKTEAKIDLGKGDTSAATARIRAVVAELGASAVILDDVNTSSLKALIKRRQAAGSTVPELSKIGGFQFKQSTITIKE